VEDDEKTIGCFHKWGIPKMDPNEWFVIMENAMNMDD